MTQRRRARSPRRAGAARSRAPGLPAPRLARAPPHRGGEPILDVLIVGAGQGGLATAFGLMRERVTNLLVVDQNPLDRAGPWLNFARMRTLRTPKHVTGPDLGIPSLTPEAYYEAQHGEGSWRTAGPDSARRPGRPTWPGTAARWRFPCAPTRASARCAGTRATARGRSRAAQPARRRRTPPPRRPCTRGAWCWRPASTARASGRPGDDPRSPAARAVRAHALGHRLRRRWPASAIAVLGAGASAFDNAATALEHGAREVRLCFRRHALVNVNAYRWAEFVGFLKHVGDLPDADKWRFIRQILRMGQLPPADTYDRARRNAGFHLHAACAWTSVEAHGDVVRIQTAAGETHEADFVIVGTGFVDRPAPSPRAGGDRSAHRALGRPLRSAGERASRGSGAPSVPRTRASSSPNASRARRRTCAISTTTRSVAC